ncbi:MULTISPECIES: alpha-amylase family glycosyl hydrolase [Micrococcus]|uniref:Alpha-amylase family glycosyl hydrolase n=1 Tax=Micrococcus yunnanensis TaxID=566027 RepID=A0AAP5WEM5_9MICC|nr:MULTISPECIES: alpha-amylase family glycosyl hydrolase [Micrococcus]MBS9537971.1 glycoside hydrolase family 13 protein [Micrococcus luteus]MCV7471536.1 glycoside hydrolase family 13 protein [Micrococcus luteus]MCV7487086.1 glycoside hydrolase family 13 protein [Micrococcus luteus]MCV7493253.1 glycoside hydrolase family 13 protein [Micrococcus luteus]MCV7599375.1 glycoside hydrolase family 13 protein [Micrococcus luteus]
MTTQRLSTPPSEARNRPVTPWWVDAVIYQVYPRSFADADGDGMGDLRGVTSRLDYLAQLGVDAIWLSPFYLSPQHDAGYDVADYRAVDPRFGTLADADEMIAAAHEAGIRVVVDLVPNHTSSEHAWFQAALAAGPGSPERARYHFAEGRGEHGELPPNNWESTFGGGAWTRVTEADGTPGQWYLHLFDTTQPDLNWENEEVREEFRSILRFWLDRGVDGFRVDVAHGLIKQPGYPDAEHSRMGMVTDAGEDADPTFDPDTFEPLTPFMDQDRVHEVYRHWRRVLDSYDHEPMMVAEAWVAPLSRMFRYVRPGEMHQTFNFTYLMAGWDAESLTSAIDRSFEHAERVGAPNTWVLSNHDTVRHASRYGLADPSSYPAGITAEDEQPDEELGRRRARAAALVELALPGSAYIYQGDELGLPEHTTLAAEQRTDPYFFRTDGKEPGRDGCRIPLPWAADETSYGFSTPADDDGPASAAEGVAAPWLPQPASFRALAADRQVGVEGSVFELYRRLLQIRGELDLGTGTFAWSEHHDPARGVLAFTVTSGGGRHLGSGEPIPARTVLVMANLSTDPVDLPAGHSRALFSLEEAEAVQDGQLAHDAAAWLLMD